MWGQRISLIYFYLISVISIILLVIGIYHLVTFTLNLTMYDKYPTRWGGVEEQCENNYYPPRVLKQQIDIPPQLEASPSAIDIEKQKQLCLKNLERERKLHMIENLKNTITFTLTGAILFGLHFPVALRKSGKEK